MTQIQISHAFSYLGCGHPQLSPWQHRKLRHVNVPLWQSDQDLYARIMQLVSRKAGARDPELVAFIRKILDPPSDHRQVKMSGGFIETPQAKAVRRLLHNMVRRLL